MKKTDFILIGAVIFFAVFFTGAIANAFEQRMHGSNNVGEGRFGVRCTQVQVPGYQSCKDRVADINRMERSPQSESDDAKRNAVVACKSACDVNQARTPFEIGCFEGMVRGCSFGGTDYLCGNLSHCANFANDVLRDCEAGASATCRRSKDNCMKACTPEANNTCTAGDLRNFNDGMQICRADRLSGRRPLSEGEMNRVLSQRVTEVVSGMNPDTPSAPQTSSTRPSVTESTNIFNGTGAPPPQTPANETPQQTQTQQPVQQQTAAGGLPAGNSGSTPSSSSGAGSGAAASISPVSSGSPSNSAPNPYGGNGFLSNQNFGGSENLGNEATAAGSVASNSRGDGSYDGGGGRGSRGLGSGDRGGSPSMLDGSGRPVPASTAGGAPAGPNARTSGGTASGSAGTAGVGTNQFQTSFHNRTGQADSLASAKAAKLKKAAAAKRKLKKGDGNLNLASLLKFNGRKRGPRDIAQDNPEIGKGVHPVFNPIVNFFNQQPLDHEGELSTAPH